MSLWSWEAEGGVGARARRVLENPWWLAVLSGLVFVAIFQWRYAGINPELFLYRDDGVITLSHGRNWIDFGFIGVNPSGERLEATSAPLQLLLYTLAYGLARMDYQVFMSLQTLACTFGIGCLFALLFRDKPVFALAAGALGAVVLAQMTSFMLWHASGMENALSHFFLLWTVWVLYRFWRERAIDMRWLAVPFMASIVRVDSIVHVAPAVAVFVLWWEREYHDRRGIRFAGGLATLWVVFNLCRFAYFGSFLPNTAVAQGISVGERMIEFFTLNPIFLDQSMGLSKVMFSAHGGYVLALVVPLILFRERRSPDLLLLALACMLVLTSLAVPFAFGHARLDHTRTTTQLAIFSVLAVMAAYSWEWRPGDRYMVAVVALVVFFVHERWKTPPYNLCCSAVELDGTGAAFEKIALAEGITRPTVANPDLGITSWRKRFNIVDLGFLGSSLVARLDTGPAFNRYFFDYAAPDMIESHTWWTCRYAGVLTDPRFLATYAFVGRVETSMASCKDSGRVPTGVWVRRDVTRGSSSRERVLMDDLAREPTVARVGAELAKCSPKWAVRKEACAYVTRSVYRVLPEFRSRGDVPALAQLFDKSPSRDFDLFLIRGADDPRAWRAALAYLTH